MIETVAPNEAMTPEQILTQLPIWRGIPALIPIEEGRTNKNFLVEADGKRFFGRVGTDLPHHGVWRESERRCAIMAAEGGIAPRVHYAANGILITDFCEGRTLHLADMREATTIRETALVLRRLHALPVISDLSPYCGVVVSKTYLDALPDDALPISRRRIIDRLGPPAPRGECLVHGDIIPENLIRTADAMVLIDWEYAGLGIPEVDLASVIANGELTTEEIRLLLDVYGPHRAELVEQQRVALIIREALWCVTQMRQGEPEGDLVAYTRRCVDRMLGEL